MPGTLTERPCVSAAAGASWPISRFSITRRGDNSHMRVAAGTGQIASTPASGSRRMPLANDEAALFGLPGRTLTVGKPQAAPVEEALARVVVDQQLAHRLLRAVGRLRRQRLRVRHDVGQRAAEHGDRAREHDLGRMGEGAAAFEQVPRRVDVDAPAEVEVRLGLAAHHRGEVKDAVGVAADRRGDERGVGDVAGDGAHAWIGEAIGVRRRRPARSRAPRARCRPRR